MNKRTLNQTCKNFEKEFNLCWDRDYGNLVNSTDYKNIPFQRWHYYQESYSPEIIIKILNHLNFKTPKLSILDPFSGSGATLVAMQSLGISGSAIELNPFSAFLSKVKTKEYSFSSIEICKSFELPKYKVLNNIFEKYDLSIIEKMYSIQNLSKINLIRKKIQKLEDQNAKEILEAVLLCILEETSNYKKGGNGLKLRKQDNKEDVYIAFQKKLDQILNDIQTKKTNSNIQIFNDNVTNMDKYITNNSIDVSIFSPPYVNCFDYFEVYKIELWLGEFVKSYDELRKLRKSALRSNLNTNLIFRDKIKIHSDILTQSLSLIEGIQLWDKRISKMISLYFVDMQNFLINLKKKIKQNGYVAIVVGNSAYGGIPVATDLILSELAKNCGFRIEEIIVARNNETSSQNYKKIGNLIGYIRESIILLKNENC